MRKGYLLCLKSASVNRYYGGYLFDFQFRKENYQF